jgi:hypothetical protein
VGSVGTEVIESVDTAAWLESFSDEVPDADIGTFGAALALRLTDVWQRDSLASVLEVLVTGVVKGDPQFLVRP